MRIEHDDNGDPITFTVAPDEWRTLAECEKPNWGPLEAAAPADTWGDFMWMFRIPLGDRGIEAYKHTDTRRCLHLDDTGQAWQPDHDGTWTRQPTALALINTLDLGAQGRSLGLDGPEL